MDTYDSFEEIQIHIQNKIQQNVLFNQWCI